ncbi:MAG: DUF58 domain-containing protein [Planctomycetes bacterium]|nr:DUF58 domain-containing protein [Planctomycetota bacterium]
MATPPNQPSAKYLEPETVARLSNLSLVGRLVVEGFITGLHKSPHKGFSVEFAEHRQYAPGDDLRYLDWTVYARTDHFFIKQFEEETNVKAYLLLDRSASMGFGSGPVTKLQYACYLTAALTYLMIRQRDGVGLVIFDSDIRRLLPPKSRPTQLRAILDELQGLEPGEPSNLSRSFHHLAENLKRRGLILVLSDLLDNPEEVMPALQHFRHNKHELIVFHILDPRELDFDYPDYATFADMETGRKLPVDPAFFRQAYQKKMEALQARYRRFASESRMDYVPLNTQVPYDRSLMAYLSKRARLE